ncbi:hypothetical protein T440DRAFT_472372 [Plenodomus tracheiphilus IPT5]|uniref:Transcription initiation factor TFIID subunit 8 n=1 Tax=Plenodomus tracheiphilus IPT5 TaxID=1408161 RepID=A0A6A7AT20_9PLEO|nr:hypothetical protein T440DRAFT_472372 [Plenodomus tracheiphilus IPT5]
MPGIILSPVSSKGAIAGTGMKRPHAAEAAPVYGQPHHKKRKTLHQLRHTQPVQHIVEPISAELGDFGDCKDFFDQQLRRAIAIQCRGIGFESAQQDALEEFRGLVDSYMTHLLAQVRKSMSSSRRTEMVAHDWIYAFATAGLRSSSALDQHLDTGELPPTLLQPPFDPPAPPEGPPPDTESLLGSTLSGKADKETRAYIPAHFPAFPSKHTYKATPVFTERENDPRKIREKATEEGILAEQSLRKLMAAQKAGIQKQNVGKRKRSKRMKESDTLWQEAMVDLLAEEKARDKEDRRRRAQTAEDDEGWDAPIEPPIRQSTVDRNVNLEEGLHVNYEQKFWRKSAREG